jgi:hypothetical protein
LILERMADLDRAASWSTASGVGPRKRSAIARDDLLQTLRPRMQHLIGERIEGQVRRRVDLVELALRLEREVA